MVASLRAGPAAQRHVGESVHPQCASLRLFHSVRQTVQGTREQSRRPSDDMQAPKPPRCGPPRPGSSPVGRLAGPGMPCPRCPRPCTTGHAPGAFPAAPTAQVRRALDGRSDRARPSGLRPVVAPTELRTRPCPPLTLTPHPEFPHRRTPRLGSQAGPRREVPPRVPRRRSPRVIGRPLAVHPLQTSTFGLRPYHLNLVVAVRRTRRVPADPGGTWSRRRAGQGPRVRCAGGALLNRACRATRACVVVDGRAVGVCPKRRGWSRKWRSTDSVRWNARSWLGSAWAGWRRFHRPESSATRLSPVPQRRGAVRAMVDRSTMPAAPGRGHRSTSAGLNTGSVELELAITRDHDGSRLWSRWHTDFCRQSACLHRRLLCRLGQEAAVIRRSRDRRPCG